VSERHKAQVRAQFGPSAAAYVTSAGHATGPDLEQLLAWGRKRGAARVLDIATGGGHTALAFLSLHPERGRADLTCHAAGRAGVHRRAGRRPEARPIRFVAGDVETLPFRAGTFGTVTCRIAGPPLPGPAARAA